MGLWLSEGLYMGEYFVKLKLPIAKEGCNEVAYWFTIFVFTNRDA